MAPRSYDPTFLRSHAPIFPFLLDLPRYAAPLLPGVVVRGARRTAAGAPLLYLTFDDGPADSHGALLDCLATHEAPALFFFLGEKAAARPDLVRAAVEAGHGVGLHGWTHADPWRLSRAALLGGFERATGLLEDLTGAPVRDVRPAHGHLTPALGRWCRENGRRLVLWDLMPGDFVASPAPEAVRAEAVARRLRRGVRPGSVVVLHEGGAARAVAPVALDGALPALRAAGWHLGAL